jgi:hypothetical protein
MNEAKRRLVRTWLVKAEHDPASAQGLWDIVLSVLPDEYDPGQVG